MKKVLRNELRNEFKKCYVEMLKHDYDIDYDKFSMKLFRKYCSLIKERMKEFDERIVNESDDYCLNMSCDLFINNELMLLLYMLKLIK